MTRKIDIDIERVKELRAQNMSVEGIAKELGVSKATMIRTIQRNDLYHDKLDIPIEELKNLRDKGYTLKEIAKHFKCERTAICRRIAKEGLYLESKSLREYFEERLKENRLTRCLEWQSTLDRDGYGKCDHRDLSYKKGAHRVSYELYKGEIPDGLMVRHMCNNRKCCNPDHLELGTAFDNYNDAVRDGSFPKTKVSKELVAYVKRLLKDDWTQRKVANYIGVSETTICRWKNGALVTLRD